MAKTRRLITENLKNVHIIIEVLDARVPVSSRNPELRKMTGDKPTILLLNKASLADPAKSRAFMKHYTDSHTVCILCDCVTGEGLNKLPEAIRTVLKDRVERYEEKGQAGRHLRAMVVGVPNVGKSTLINRMSGGIKAKAENRPGVTRNKQWVSTGIGIDLLDMPGVLWPKFEDQFIGENLAVTGAIRDDILDIEHLALKLVKRLRELYPKELAARFKLADSDGWVWLLLPLYGAYTALTDGVGKAWVSDLLPERAMGTGLGYFQGITGGCALVAGIWAGLAWGDGGSTPLIVSGAIAALVAVFVAVSPTLRQP
jgi:ribosome biogenesis GTPase A